MTAYVEDTLWAETLPAVANDESIPNRTDSKAAILAAIQRAADEHDKRVHISYVRPYLPAWVTPQMVGAVFAGLHLSGHLCATTKTLPNGGPSGNASKPAKVSRLTKPIEVTTP